MKFRLSLLIFLFLYSAAFAGGDVKVVSSTKSSVIVEYYPSFSDTSLVKLDNREYLKLQLDGGIVNPNLIKGQPMLPVREFNIGVPSEFGNTIQVLSSQYEIINGKILPIENDRQLSKEQKSNVVFKSYESFTEDDLVVFSNFGYVRELPVQTVMVRPVQFNAQSGSIKVYKKIVFKVNFGNQGSNTYLIKDKFVKDVVLNFDVAKNWGKKETTGFKKISNSLLATGTWYRFEAPVEGIYKIDANYLSSVGIDPGSVDPRTIKIYNNGGYQLPENINDSRPNELTEIAIYVNGENDGSFDSGDYVLFYGRGTNFWEYDSDNNNFVRSKNYFSKKNYFWITSGGSQGKRMEMQSSLNENNFYNQTSTKAFKYFEEDKINLGQSGRDYWGDVWSIDTQTRTYVNSLDGIIPGSDVTYNYRFANASTVNVPVFIEVNGSQIQAGTAYGYPNCGSCYYFGQEFAGSANYNGEYADDRSVLKFSISTSSSSLKLYMDYYEIEFQKDFRAVNDSIIFYSYDTTSSVQYSLSNFSNSSIGVFNISDYSNVKLVNNAFVSGGDFRFQATENAGNVSKYIGLTSDKYRTPGTPEQVENSNVRGIAQGAELIIITDKTFQNEAEAYRDYRVNSSPISKISAQIVYVDEIYDEFSGGSLDPTAIRDFIKYAYDNWTPKPFYVLLFGDGTYDYYNVEGLGDNYIPTYQTKESLRELSSYPSDDYYVRVSGNDNKVDLATGRLNIQTSENAQTIINKIETYESNSDNGLWKDKVTLVADDGPAGTGVDDGNLHTRQSENLSKNKIPGYFIQNKIYLATYPTVNTGLGRRKPGVNTAIINAVNNGTLILNFIGHGNPTTWTHEHVFEKSVTIPQFQNDKYFFLTAATCDFGKYDTPGEQSATEDMLFMPNAGIIGALTAARIVYSSLNAALNDSFYTNLFRTTDQNGLPVRIGEAYFLMKQYRTGDNDEKFHLYCDPSLRLAAPQSNVAVDSVNNKALDMDVQVKALSNVTLDGTVRNTDGTINNFNGEGIISVFDSERIIDLKEMNYQMTVQGGVIFRGRVTVENGRFSTGFTVPKDISYENKKGKIVAYLFNDQKDAIGFTDKIIVGGTDTTVTDDGTGPKIEIYFDNLSFESSYLVNPDFNLLVKLSDQTGLNTTGTGVGHRLEGILNEDEEKPIDFTNYFIGDVDAGGKSGLINYRFSGLESGDYKIKIKAWDVFNNLSEETNYFSVVESGGLVIRDVYNYPNPFASNTTFTFQHNLTQPLDVKVKVYTIAGRLIAELEKDNILEKFVKVDWDGRDEDGNQIANGTYLYKLVVQSVDGEFKENILGKLAVIR